MPKSDDLDASRDVPPAQPQARSDTVADDANRNRLLGGLLLVASSVLVGLHSASPLWFALAGFSVAGSIGLGQVARASRRAPGLLLAVTVLAVVCSAWFPIARANSDLSPRDRTHDGGVTVTVESARMVLRGQNPYSEDFRDVVDPSWATVEGADGEIVDNPILERQPYLPLAFLVNVPLVVAADLADVGYDTRVLAWAAVSAAVIAVARRTGPAWVRVAAVGTVANAFALAYLAWGTNDAFAAAALLGALLVGQRRPGVGGLLLAIAVSTKFLLAAAVLPLLIVLWRSSGWSVIRRWWTFPAAMAVTILPYMLWDRSAFFDDALLFNLGLTEPKMPTSGLGLPAVAPGIFDGPTLAVATVIVTFGGLAVVALCAWRRPRWDAIGPLASIALLAILVPARTFQINYLAMVCTAAATGWWLFGGADGDTAESDLADDR